MPKPKESLIKNPLLKCDPFFNLKDKICVEIGVKTGKFSRSIYACEPKHLYLVDCWEHQDDSIYKNDKSNHPQKIQDEYYENVKKTFQDKKNVTVMKMYSVDASKKFKDNFFDFIYIDANHNFDPFYQDLCCWYPKVKKGGLFSGHDLHYRRRLRWGIVPALERFCTENKIKYFELTRNSWGIIKK